LIPAPAFPEVSSRAALVSSKRSSMDGRPAEALGVFSSPLRRRGLSTRRCVARQLDPSSSAAPARSLILGCFSVPELSGTAKLGSFGESCCLLHPRLRLGSLLELGSLLPAQLGLPAILPRLLLIPTRWRAARLSRNGTHALRLGAPRWLPVHASRCLEVPRGLAGRQWRQCLRRPADGRLPRPLQRHRQPHPQTRTVRLLKWHPRRRSVTNGPRNDGSCASSESGTP